MRRLFSVSPCPFRLFPCTFSLVPFLLALGACLLVLASDASACPNCFSSTGKDTLKAYYFSTIALTMLPLGIFGSIIGWVVLKFRKADIEQSSHIPG